jgi:TetR/AcrR family fatty acid metabolism transcriptional regulator
VERTPRARRGDSRARSEKKERILAGAVQAFAARGFHATRVRDVAQAAGVADGTIYLYFRSKNELLATIFRSALERFWERGAAFLWEDEAPPHQMDRLVHLHLTFLGEDRQLAVVFQVDLRHSVQFLGEVSRNTLRHHLDRVAEIIARGQAEGVFTARCPPHTAAGMVFGVLDQLVTNWILSRRNYRLESQIPAAQEFIARALGSVSGDGAISRAAREDVPPEKG